MDELESALLVALERLRPTLVALGMPAGLEDREAAAWLRSRFERGWERELQTSTAGPA